VRNRQDIERGGSGGGRKKPDPQDAGRPRAAIWDGARVAGVRTKTVSRELNGGPGVAPATAAAIQAAIATLCFRRNELARLLRTGGRARTLGLVLHGLDTPHGAGVAGAVAQAALEQGYLAITGSTQGDAGAERQLISWLLDRQVDGLLLMPSGDGVDYLSAELKQGLPMVVVDAAPAEIDVDSVTVDNVDGARQATHHLLRHWHRLRGRRGPTG